MLDHAFGTLGLHRVGLAVFEFNERAIRAYRKCGFVAEGRAREAIWRDGRFWDEIEMSILQEEWRAARDAELAPVDGHETAEAAGDARPEERLGSRIRKRALHVAGR
jgi:hypothetical protein